MSGNEAFEMVSERGWRRGLNNMLRSGIRRWFKTRTWWVHCLIWGGMIGLIMVVIVTGTEPPPYEELLVLFSVFAGLFPAVGVTIIMQDALVGEKREGTAAWVLSKPVTRQAFVLSKILANSVGILVNMVVVPCLIGYAIISISQKSAVNPLGLLEAMGVIFLSHFFFLTLTLMLGTLFNSRGPVIGIPLAILFLQQNIISLIPALRFVLPWNLIVPLPNSNALVLSLMSIYTPVQSDQMVLPLVILAQCILFILVGLWRFSREEF